jgi:hypothetical protein
MTAAGHLTALGFDGPTADIASVHATDTRAVLVVH